MDKTDVIEKPKRGRRPKPESEKITERICLHMWEDEYEIFTLASKPDSIASFLREAVHDLINSGLKKIDSPRPVTRGLGTQFTMLLTDKEKQDFDDAAANRFGLPLSGLIRAAGMRKASVNSLK